MEQTFIKYETFIYTDTKRITESSYYQRLFQLPEILIKELKVGEMLDSEFYLNLFSDEIFKIDDDVISEAMGPSYWEVSYVSYEYDDSKNIITKTVNITAFP